MIVDPLNSNFRECGVRQVYLHVREVFNKNKTVSKQVHLVIIFITIHLGTFLNILFLLYFRLISLKNPMDGE